MSSANKYFAIPFNDVPENPPYTVWFATWSRERPAVAPGMEPPMVVGVTSSEALPAGATLLSTGSKDPPPPPPPPPSSVISQPDYQQLVNEWMLSDRGQDE